LQARMAHVVTPEWTRAGEKACADDAVNIQLKRTGLAIF
jgi:hypothetical protein